MKINKKQIREVRLNSLPQSLGIIELPSVPLIVYCENNTLAWGSDNHGGACGLKNNSKWIGRFQSIDEKTKKEIMSALRSEGYCSDKKANDGSYRNAEGKVINLSRCWIYKKLLPTNKETKLNL